MPELILIAHNLRSTHNVGSLLRTADGLGVETVFLTGYTPYPALSDGETRLPHEVRKLDKQIHKSALGAEISQRWQHNSSVSDVINRLKTEGYTVAALEQDPASLTLPDYRPPQKLALLLGREVEGVEPEVLRLCDLTLEIPMQGSKESFNVAQAAAMALYHCTYI